MCARMLGEEPVGPEAEAVLLSEGSRETRARQEEGGLRGKEEEDFPRGGDRDLLGRGRQAGARWQ